MSEAIRIESESLLRPRRRSELRRTRLFCGNLKVKLYSTYYNLFWDSRTGFRLVRSIIALPLGVLLGILLYRATIHRTSIDSDAKRLLGYSLIGCVSIGFGVSRQFRCLVCLMVPVMAGRYGRTLLAAYAMSLVLTGPIENTVRNFGDAMRGAGCLAVLRFNMTVEKLRLKFEPVWDIIKQLEVVGSMSKNATKDQNEIWSPIKKEVSDNSEVAKEKNETSEADRKLNVGESRVEMIQKKLRGMNKEIFGGKANANYAEKNAFRCEDMYNRAIQECLNALNRAHKRCKDKFKIISGLVCWGFTQSSTCNRLDGRKELQKCSSDQGTPEGFGEGYETMDEATNQFAKEFEYSLTAKILPNREKIDDITPVEVARTLEYQFQQKRETVSLIATIVNHFISFIFILVVLKCRTYLNKYLTKIDFDNYYITSYFRKIDESRKKEGKMTLLPVKKTERDEICDPLSWTYSKAEMKKMGTVILPMILQVLAVSGVFGFDYLTWQTLDMLRRLGRMEYTQKGVHIVRLTVHGKGFMADLVRNVVKDLNVEKYVDKVHSNWRCLPSPTQTSLPVVLRIYSLYVLVFVLIYVELYVIRSRPFVCGFFFPKRQKKRVIFFYNQRVKYRKNYIRHAVAYVKKQARLSSGGKRKSRWVEWLFSRWPRLKNLVGGPVAARCDVCDRKLVVQPEWKGIECANPKCPITYCADCWNEFGQRCHACQDDDVLDDGDQALADTDD